MTIRLRQRALVAGLLVVSALLLAAALDGDATARKRSARAILRDAAGNRVGAVTLEQKRGATEVTAQLRNLTPGFHGFHVHAVGVCEPDAPGGPFTTAGGHLTSGSAAHGNHAGDMPSLLVRNNGRPFLKLLTDRFTVEQLLDADGSAIIVHAGRDNFANIPTRYHSHPADTFGPDSATLATGDSGARIACGVIKGRKD